MPARRYGVVIRNAGIAFFPALQERIQIPIIIDIAIDSQKRLLGIHAEEVDGREYAFVLYGRR